MPSTDPQGPEESAREADTQARPAPPAAEEAARQEPPPTLLEEQPTVVGLARLARKSALPHGDEAVYRRVAQLAELQAEHEFLLVPCGRGLATQFMAETTGAAGSGVDPDPQLTTFAAERAREAGLSQRLHYDSAPPADLPYKDDIFDLTVGDVGLAAAPDAAAAVADLARVTKPRGTVVLIEPVWNRAIEPERRDVLIEHLGVRPHLLVEWKQMLRDAGVVDLIVEDLTDSANPWQPLLGMGATIDFLTMRERFELLYRAWNQWGGRGVRQAIRGARELRQLVARERILGLVLIKGTRWSDAAEAA